jgi:uncharacterized protein (TIGR02246 family)
MTWPGEKRGSLMTRAARSTFLMVAGLFILTDTGTTRTSQTRDPRPVEEAVLTTSAEMARAAAAVDAERLFGFMLETDKGSVIQDGVFLATREEALERVKANLRGISKIEYRWKRQHVTVLSEDAALLTADGESVATTTEGEVFTTPFAQTVVFVMREGRWKAIHAHQSSPQMR